MTSRRCPGPRVTWTRSALSWSISARDLNLDTTVDDAGNVLIRKPASKGMEITPGVVLQAHMDMVAQKTADKGFDFLTDPIQAYVAGDWVHADDTTLGADDGIGIAIIMAMLQRKDLVAPAIEALFTVDEETTMSGMNGLGKRRTPRQRLHQHRLGGRRPVHHRQRGRDDGAKQPGLPGGRRRANQRLHVLLHRDCYGANGRPFRPGYRQGTRQRDQAVGACALASRHELRRAAGQPAGGTAHNAIPTEANALVEMPVAEAPWFADYLKQYETTVRKELAATEPNLAVKFITATLPAIQEAMTPASQQRVLNVLYANPQGVLRMSDSVPGLVETSNNLGVVTTKNGFVKATNLARSSVDSELTDAGVMVMSVWDLAGGQYAVTDQYPGLGSQPELAAAGLVRTDIQAALRRGCQLCRAPCGAGVRHGGRQVPADGHDIHRADAGRRALAHRAAASQHGAEGG